MKRLLALLAAFSIAAWPAWAEIITVTPASGVFIFPATVTGATSGGIPCFTSTTTMASSTLLASGAIVLGGGMGACPYTTTTGAGVVTALGYATNATGGFPTLSFADSTDLAIGGGLTGNTGTNNTALGASTLFSNTTGHDNFAASIYALYYNTDGIFNFAAGSSALQTNIHGNYNNAIGGYSMYNNYAAVNNTAIGYETLYELDESMVATTLINGYSYTIISPGTTTWTNYGAANNNAGTTFTMANAPGTGTGTAYAVGVGYNTAIGANTGRGVIYGNYNTIIGASVSGLAAGLSNAVILATGQGTVRADFGYTTTGIWTFAGAASTNTAFYNTSSVPVLSSCGTSNSVATGSTNADGQITFGSGGTPSACTVTFANAYPNYAFCTISPANSTAAGATILPYISASSKTAFTITTAVAAAGASFNYHCAGQ